jgi:hypothetical protein
MALRASSQAGHQKLHVGMTAAGSCFRCDLNPARQSPEPAFRGGDCGVRAGGAEVKHVYDRAADVFLPGKDCGTAALPGRRLAALRRVEPVSCASPARLSGYGAGAPRTTVSYSARDEGGPGIPSGAQHEAS